MTETETTTPETTPESQTTPPPETTPDKSPETVPYDRFREVNEQAKAAKAEAEKLRKEADKRAKAEMSEVERAKTEKEEAEKRAEEAEAKATRLERSGWVRSAAAKLGFQNPNDAIAFVELDKVDSTEKAEKAVAEVGKERGYLLMGETERQGLASVLDQKTSGEIPLGPDGKPDVKRGMGQDFLKHLTGQ